MVVNEGAVGFNLGVAGRWDDEGRVPMGACRGRLCLSIEESWRKSGSPLRPRGKWPEEPYEGRRVRPLDQVDGEAQSNPSGLR